MMQVRKFSQPRIAIREQRGAVLIVGLIMLVLITVMITSTFSLTSNDLRSVANMQFRNEAVAAANTAIERVISSPFTNAPTAEEILVDIDNDGDNDFNVVFAAPTCIDANPPITSTPPPSGLALGSAFNSVGTSYRETTWDLNATVQDLSNSGATVQVHQGVRILLTDAQFNAVCS